MTGRPVPRGQLPAGVTCALTAGGAPLDAETLAQVEQFKTFLRRAKEIGAPAADAEVYGDDPTTTTGA